MRKVVLPKTFKVGGFDYKILLGQKVTRDLIDRHLFGEHSGGKREIRLCSTHSEQQLSSIFLHEVLHAIDCVYNYYSLSDESVEVLANGLTQVFEQLGVRFVI